MPTKPSHITATATLPVDNQKTWQPVKGFKQAVARLAKPVKGFASGNNRPANAQATQLQNKAPSAQMLAKAREQADNFIARTYASKTVEELCSSTELGDCRLKLMNIKLLLMDIEEKRDKLISTLGDSPASSLENQLQIRYEILKLDQILDETKVLKTECLEQLNTLFDSQVQKIQNYIGGLRTELTSSSGSRNQDLRTQIFQAEFELMKLNHARDEGRL